MTHADLASLNIAAESVGTLCSRRKTTLLTAFLTTFRSIALYTPTTTTQTQRVLQILLQKILRSLDFITIQPPFIFLRCITDCIQFLQKYNVSLADMFIFIRHNGSKKT